MKQGVRPPKEAREHVLELAGLVPRPTNRDIRNRVQKKFDVELDEASIRRYCQAADLPTSTRKESDSDDHRGGAPQVAISENSQRHQALVSATVQGVRRRLEPLPPVPRDMFKSDSGGYLEPRRAAQYIAAIEESPSEFRSLSQHLDRTGFKSAYDGCCTDLKAYEQSAATALRHVEVELRSIGLGSSGRLEAFRMYAVSMDKACVNCGRYTGGHDEAGSDFPYFAEKPKVVHPDGTWLVFSGGEVKSIGNCRTPEVWQGATSEVRIGPFRFGTVSSYDEAVQAVVTLSELADRLYGDRPLQDLANQYFDLTVQRDQLLKNKLTPMVVEKWIADGRCKLCPS